MGRSRAEDPVAAGRILGVRVDATSYADAAARVVRWATSGESRYVCVANVHMVMESRDDPSFRAVVNGADLVTADGMPLVWALRLLGVRSATRVYGPDLTPAVCEAAAERGVPVGFYGGTEDVVARMTANLGRRVPGLRVVYRHSPPFRRLTDDETAADLSAIRRSGARILFVGLGCPKQERWMAAQRGKLDAVMLGVGAAFDFLAGTKAQAPRALQRLGLEWCFRLAHEPRRLWRRYLRHNPRFVLLFAAQMLRPRADADQ
jgi:N-acetylglucosaminyldiphosphoundecaprenol N-acetyl-beta-D-mannosaminyltransferase